MLLTNVISNSVHKNFQLANISKTDCPNTTKYVRVAGSHSPISIEGNADFASQAIENGWPGNGTEDNPYIIANLTISTSTLYAMKIQFTDVYFTIRNCSVTVLNLNISWKSGIEIFNVQNARIENCTCKIDWYCGDVSYEITQSRNIILMNNIATSHAFTGFSLSSSSNITIFNNTVENHGWGINLMGSGDNMIRNNFIRNCTNGISIIDSGDNSFINNTMVDSGFGLWGDIEDIEQEIIENNTVNGKPVIYLQHQSGFTITGAAGQIVLFDCSSIIIQNYVFSRVFGAITLVYSNYNTIYNNSISDCYISGFWVRYSSYNTFSYNIATNNCIGYDLEISDNNIFINNTALNNRRGFSIDYSNWNSLINNTAQDYDNERYSWDPYKSGFYLWGSNDNLITNNTIYNNTKYGIMLGGAERNQIKYNIIRNNTDYGIYIDKWGKNNSVKFNNFLNNNNGGMQAYCNDSTSVFEFNYWSDHITPDANGDHMVDTPYSIDGDVQCKDMHPLTEFEGYLYIVISTSTFPRIIGYHFLYFFIAIGIIICIKYQKKSVIAR